MNVSGRFGSRTCCSSSLLPAQWIPLWWKGPPSPATSTFSSNATGFPRICNHPLASAEPRTLETWDSHGTVPKGRVAIRDPCPPNWGEIIAHPHADCGDGGWLTSTHPFCLPNGTQSGPWQGSVCPASELKLVSTVGVFQSAYENHPAAFKIYLHWDNLFAIYAWPVNYDERWPKAFLFLIEGKRSPFLASRCCCLHGMKPFWDKLTDWGRGSGKTEKAQIAKCQ